MAQDKINGMYNVIAFAALNAALWLWASGTSSARRRIKYHINFICGNLNLSNERFLSKYIVRMIVSQRLGRKKPITGIISWGLP
jgi:hypothetical protein